MTAFLKAAAKTVAAFLVAWLATRGVEVDSAAMELVITGLFVGLGSIVLNGLLLLVGKTPFGAQARSLLPNYQEK